MKRRSLTCFQLGNPKKSVNKFYYASSFWEYWTGYTFTLWTQVNLLFYLARNVALNRNYVCAFHANTSSPSKRILFFVASTRRASQRSFLLLLHWVETRKCTAVFFQLVSTRLSIIHLCKQEFEKKRESPKMTLRFQLQWTRSTNEIGKMRRICVQNNSRFVTKIRNVFERINMYALKKWGIIGGTSASFVLFIPVGHVWNVEKHLHYRLPSTPSNTPACLAGAVFSATCSPWQKQRR